MQDNQPKTDGRDNGKLTDDALMAISAIAIMDPNKYTNEDRNRREKLEGAERLKRYQSNPESFIETKREVIVCMIRTPYGPMLYLGGHRQELQLAWAELNRKISHALDDFETQSKPKIHKPGQFISGLKRMFK